MTGITIPTITGGPSEPLATMMLVLSLLMGVQDVLAIKVDSQHAK